MESAFTQILRSK